MREAILGCLQAYLAGSNLDGKVTYISEFQGLKQLSRLICVKKEDEKAMFGVTV